MRWLTQWRLRLRSLFQRKRVDEELDAELQFYLDHVSEAHLSAGASKPMRWRQRGVPWAA